MKGRTRGNGQGTVFKRGRTWTARVVIGWRVADDGHAIPIYRSRGGFHTKREALDHCAVLLKSPRAEKQLAMKEIYDAWYAIHETKVSKSTMDCYKAAWKYFQPLHDMTFAYIDTDDLQECLDDCGQGKRTRENMKALAGLLMKYALPRHQTDMNYADFLYTGDGEKGTHPAFTPAQVLKLRQSVGVIPHADYLCALIYTGLRPAEFLSLRKEDYRDGVLYGGIKTEAGKNRAVPVSPRIKDIIENRLRSVSEYLFPKDDGSPMTTNYFRKYIFYQVLADTGIQAMPTGDKPAYYTPYSCRHTFANMLKDAPGSDKDKAGLIGHADYRTTQKHYQTAELEALKSIINSL